MFFEYPKLLFLEFILLPLIALYVYREIKGKRPALTVSSASQWKSGGNSGLMAQIEHHIPFVLRMIALALIILCIARPRSSKNLQKVNSEGIDIELAMDCSSSMLARDFKPDRIGAAKDIAIEFISSRPTDRIGIVVFAGESYTQCPLTTDRATLVNLMKDIQTGIIDDGTAIGNGLATAVSRLKESDAKSRVVILLTDGMNNAGEIAPQMAAEIAKTYGIRVYTIGVGAMGTAPYPVQTPWGIQMQPMQVEIDEDLLKGIAETTGGKYFRATDNTKLAEIYGEINKMEKNRTTVDSFPVYSELYPEFAIWALIALLLEVLLRFVVLKRLP
jgi:Ca-activated chloride channel family protein